MKPLWQSNSPWSGTGYGQQTGMILGEIKHVHEVSCFAFYGLQGNTIEYDGYKIYPNSNFDPVGNDVVKAHLLRSGSDLLITLMDLFVLDPQVYGNLPVPWCAWVPIDHEEIGWPTFERLKLVDYPVAMSKFGAKEIDEAGVQVAQVIYHAVDTDVFKPMDPDEKRTAREFLGINPKYYVIGMVMANKGDRKQMPTQLTAIRRWIDEVSLVDPELADNVRLYIHTEPTVQMGGWDLKSILAKAGLKGRAFTTGQYDVSVVPLERELMARMYGQMDVLLNVSGGEGFGIPIVEAQACGIPVLAGNYTAMPELIANGYAIEPAFRGLAAHFGYQFAPSVDDIVRRLHHVYRMTDKARRMIGRQWVVDNCSLPVIVKQWLELLDNIAAVEKEKKQERKVYEQHPQGPLDELLQQARASMEAELPEYGSYETRKPEYRIIYKEMQRLGLKNGDRILDLGAGFGDLGRYLYESGWAGTYVPVDMIIDGTDLDSQDYQVPFGFNFIVIQQCIEHLVHWQRVLVQAEARSGAVVITTPNVEVVGEGEKHDFPGQMAHVKWFSPYDFEDLGYETTLHTLTGRHNDTVLAWKITNVEGAFHGKL